MDIYIIDSDGQNLKCLTNNNGYDFSPSWYIPKAPIQIHGDLVTT